MVEKTIELTDEQMERVALLEESGLSVGDAVDMLFQIKKDIELHTNQIENGLHAFENPQNQNQEEALENEHAPSQDYGNAIKSVKKSIDWTRDYLKF